MADEKPKQPLPPTAFLATTKETSHITASSSASHTNVEDDEISIPSMSPLQRRTLMICLCLIQFLSALDTTIITTALPTITRSLRASASEYAWVGSSYTLACTSLTPVWGKMSDVFGLKSMLMLSNGIFMAGSLIAALAHSPGMLIAGRTVQGVGGGGIQVLVTITIGKIFKLEDRAKYYGITAGVWAIASAVGPVLGGVFTQAVSWRWCFYINLPFDGVSLVLLFFALHIQTPKVPIIAGLQAVDWTGSAIIVAGTILFLLGLETGAGGTQSWDSAEVLCLLIFGILLLAGFIFFEAKVAKTPLIPIRVFSSITRAAAFGTTCLHSFVFISYDYYFPVYMQMVLRLSPINSGVSMFALVVPLTMCTLATGFFVKETGTFVLPLYFMGTIMTLGTGLFIDFSRNVQWYKIILFQVVAGIGAGPGFQTPLIALQAHTEPKDLTAAMSAMTFLRMLFASMSIVIGSVILQSKLGGKSLSNSGKIRGNEDEYVHALRMMWIFYTCVSAAMLGLTYFVKSKNIKKKQDDNDDS